MTLVRKKIVFVALMTASLAGWLVGANAQVSSGSPSSVRICQFGGPQRQEDEKEKEKARLRIGITREQQQQIEVMFADSDKLRKEIGTKIRDLYKQLNTIYDDYEFEREKAMQIRKEINGQHRRMMMLFAENEEKLRKILNKEQFGKMRNEMREKMEKMRRDREDGRRPPKPA